MSKWFNDIGAGLTKIGKGVRGAADGARKVVGIKVGSVQISLDQRHFHPGDKITGTVSLELTEPTRAEKLVVGLRGSRQKISYAKSSGGGKMQQTHTENVHLFKHELAGEQEFEGESYPFELVVPDDATQAQPEIKTDGILGDVARVVTSVASSNRSTVSWEVFAVLEIPWKRNVRSAVDVAVTSADR